MDDDDRLYVGERKKPANCPDIRSAREAFEDPENQARRRKINRAGPVEAEYDRQYYRPL